MQVAGSILVIFLVDNLGRVMLLGLSAIWMSLSTFLLGIFFYLKENDYETQSFSWLPVFSLSVFLITFSVGFGAVSWMLMSELMPAAIRGPGTSIACITNWITALIVTKFYSDLVTMFGIGVTFWIFSTVSLTAAVFSFRVLPETRGKSFEEIQTKLAGSKMCSVDNITKL